MANKLDNLKKGKKTQYRSGSEAAKEAGRKGGIKSGEARREKAALEEAKKNMNVELINAIQAALFAEYSDVNGKKIIGINGIAYNLIITAMNTKNKQCIAAIKIILDMFGANIPEIDMRIKEAEAAAMQAKADMLTGADTSTLDRLDKILSEMKENADIKQQTE